METNQFQSHPLEKVSPTSTESQTVCVVGLGYVGLPIAAEFDSVGHTVYKFDIDPKRAQQLSSGHEPTGDVGDQRLTAADIGFTTDGSVISKADFVIVTVPTSVDDIKNPNLRFVKSAREMIGEQITEQTTVVIEPTVYPVATREILGPAS